MSGKGTHQDGGSGPRSSSEASRQALSVLGLAFLFPVSVFFGFRLGGWIGQVFGMSSAGSIVGGVVGAAAGFGALIDHLKVKND